MKYILMILALLVVSQSAMAKGLSASAKIMGSATTAGEGCCPPEEGGDGSCPDGGGDCCPQAEVAPMGDDCCPPDSGSDDGCEDGEGSCCPGGK